MKITLFLSVILIVILPLATGQSSCPLPTVDDIERELNDLLLDADSGGGPYDPTVSSYQYTCLAQGSTRDTYRRVSIIATFTPNNGQSSQTQHFQLDCSSGTWMARINDGFGTPPSNPMMRTDCFYCVPENLGGDSNHCSPCNSACNYGSGRCLSNSPVVCCPYFGLDNMCTTSCPTNYVASDNTNFTCVCNDTCGPGEVANATCNGCNLTDICQRDIPCQNGGSCLLLSAPNNYTCNCSGTGYNGTNCTVPSGPPSNVMVYILNETSIKVNWTMSSQANGYVIVINSTTGVGTNKILSTTVHEVIINGLTLSTYYNISVYSNKDLPSVNSTQRLLRFDVPTPVTNLSVNDVSSTTITLNWTILSSEDGNYVTYYNISYSPSCPELSSVNVTLVSVTPYQSATTFNYILRELYSGMKYIITVRAGNILGESSPVMTFGETKPTSVPFGSPKSIMALSVNLTANKIIWEDIDCHLRNDRTIEYIVIISNNSITYNVTSSERYVIVNDLVFGNVYNIRVAGVNSIGRGPFSNPVKIQIGSIPGPVGTLTSLMSTTWAVISWSVPSYIPIDYPIITYEIGYATHQFNGSCSPSDEFSPMIKTNTSSTNMTISDLMDNTYYLFGVRGYTINGYGVWTVITNQTLVDPLMTDPTLCTDSSKSSITGLGVLVGILLSVVIACSIANVLQFILNSRYRAETVTSKSKHQKDSGPDEDIKMQICEPYSFHQSKPTNESKVIYDECQLSTTDITDTSIYESI